MKRKKKLKNNFEKKLDRQIRKSKLIYEYEAEKIPFYFTGHYVPDFCVHTGRGKLYIEAKGYFRAEQKRKMVSVKKLHPALDIRIVFYSRKTKDIRWAERYGFPYAIGSIPKEWLKDVQL